VEISLILDIVAPMRSIAATASRVVSWIARIWPEISSVAVAVCEASAFTSPATTANPLPASPARAASIVALSASRLVWQTRQIGPFRRAKRPLRTDGESP